MKFRIAFKTPGAVEYAIEDVLVDQLDISLGSVSEEEEERRNQAKDEMQTLINKYVSYGENVTIEFDTNSGTAIVVEKGK